MKYEIDYEKGLVEEGNSQAIKNFFVKAKKGVPVTVGFIGGSITQGSLSTKPELCYAHRVYDWFKKVLPNTEIKYVNAGIGATDSEFAAARVSEHLLSQKPDFVLMEFAVNDEGKDDKYLETYEGALRQILLSESKPAVLLMCNVFYNDGASAERMHRKIARHYNVPVVSMRTTIYEALLAGKFANRDITPDDLHPNDDGHELVSNVITAYLQTQLDDAQDGPVDFVCPEPITLNRFEKSIKYDNRNSEAVSNGFTRDCAAQECISDCFKNGYIATEKGSFFELEVTGKCIAVQFRRTINLPAPVAKAVIDGDEENAKILDANFDETWGDKLVLEDLYSSEVSKQHKIRIEIIETHPDDKGDFYLAGIIVSG